MRGTHTRRDGRLIFVLWWCSLWLTSENFCCKTRSGCEGGDAGIDPNIKYVQVGTVLLTTGRDRFKRDVGEIAILAVIYAGVSGVSTITESQGPFRIPYASHDDRHHVGDSRVGRAAFSNCKMQHHSVMRLGLALLKTMSDRASSTRYYSGKELATYLGWFVLQHRGSSIGSLPT